MTVENARKVWIPLGLVALFAAGVATGILYERGAPPPRVEPSVHGDHSAHGDPAARHLEHFRRRLELTDEQSRRVKGVLDGVHKAAVELRGEFHREFEAVRTRAWEDIRATLSQDQLPEFEKLVQELEGAHASDRGHRDPRDDGGRDHGPHGQGR